MFENEFINIWMQAGLPRDIAMMIWSEYEYLREQEYERRVAEYEDWALGDYI